MIIKDSENNTFGLEIIGKTAHLKGEGGSKEIGIEELKFYDEDLTLTSKQFLEEVKKNTRIYRTKDKYLLKELATRKAFYKIKNEELIPYINKDYWCLTCGSKSGESHPETSYCFICNTDNWQKHNTIEL